MSSAVEALARAALILAACGALSLQHATATLLQLSSAGGVATLQCAGATGRLDAGATMAGREGSYRLTPGRDGAVGPRRAVCGSLTQRRWAADAPHFGAPVTPLYGNTDVDLAQVGAYRPGDPGSETDQAPGVLVLETVVDGERRILLRLGASANRAGLLRFDGAYTVLDVRAISGSGFLGVWRSGATGQAPIEGCSVRGLGPPWRWVTVRARCGVDGLDEGGGQHVGWSDRFMADLPGTPTRPVWVVLESASRYRVATGMPIQGSASSIGFLKLSEGDLERIRPLIDERLDARPT